MPVAYVSGDMFLSRAQTLAHGCNCRGRMGRGIAREFKRRWPDMLKDYKRRCRAGEFKPGGCYLEKSTTPWILNLATQADVGGARPEYVARSFRAVANNYSREGIASIAMPRIAAGLGGLHWEDVVELIEEILAALPIPIYVYEEFVPRLVAEEAS